ncbi:hypothetical protein B7494_g2793 [Chlorociboria aeruginascens]|nr:hypothetical protein B7494_g2793 [Chlorociboria aeruginascens]
MAPHYNPLSILRNIDLSNATSIIQIMHALSYLLSNSSITTLTPLVGKEFNIKTTDIAPVNRILLAIGSNGDEYPLLRDAVQRFIGARDQSEKAVLRATRELEELAEEDVLVEPWRFQSEYEEAVGRFRRFVAGVEKVGEDSSITRLRSLGRIVSAKQLHNTDSGDALPGDEDTKGRLDMNDKDMQNVTLDEDRPARLRRVGPIQYYKSSHKDVYR